MAAGLGAYEGVTRLDPIGWLLQRDPLSLLWLGLLVGLGLGAVYAWFAGRLGNVEEN